jgi:signal transduction histidine kinase
MELMNQPFRHDLYDKRPILQLLGYGFDQPLCIAAGERIDVAAGKALERPGEAIYEPVVIAFPTPGDYRLVDTQVLLRALSLMLAMQNDELRQARRRLIQSEKMALLGQLVAGVAHEINTPVGICLTAATHLQTLTREITGRYAAGKLTNSDLQHFLAVAGETAGLIFTNSNRAAELIQGFKQVAVDQTSQKRRSFNLGKTIRETLLSLKPQLRHSTHEIVVEGGDDIEVDSYPGSISQVLTNLVLNALNHAYDDGRENGRIVISARKNGAEVELSVADDGRGIPEADMKHIFEPFFSTRQGQGGSGLGLHIVYNLVTGTRLEMAFPGISPEAGEKNEN